MNDEAHRRRYAEAVHEARAAGGDAFQSWFNRAESEEAAFRWGYWDFAFHILTAPVCARLDDPGSKTALEIGCGGGRLLNAAACFFAHAVGIDVHDDLDTVREVLARQGRRNVTVLSTDGRTIPVDDGSVELVYSFLVLQHLPRWATLVAYLHETHRVLRPGGVAQLYAARLHARNPLRAYRELDAPVNHVSLEVSPRHLRRLARTVGFEVAARAERAYKKPPDGYPDAPGGQFGLTLVKTRA